jgi:DNA mismatch endonuclease (patch repair protein)
MSLSRSEIMRRVRAKDTKPERLVRRILTDLGYRYRLHRSDLPGKPDIAFVSRKKAIFVHGCFWHGHDCKRGARVPRANRDYWVAKIGRNRERDAANARRLAEMGWRSLALFECELKDADGVSVRLALFLRDGDAPGA